MDLVAARRRRAAAFPRRPPPPLGGYSYDLSKWFGRQMDGLGMSDRSLVMHSPCHRFREAGRRVNLDGDIIDPLGGWAPKMVGARYRNREAIPANTRHVASIAAANLALAASSQEGFG